MKMIKILPLLILLGFTSCSAPMKVHNKKPHSGTIHSTLCEPIGLDSQQLDLCVENRDGNQDFFQASFYFLKTATNTQPLAFSGLSTFRMLVSPKRKFIVIEENAGEGHGIFSIVNLDDIRAQKAAPSVCWGWDDLVGYDDLEWRGEQLYFSANQNLVDDNTSLADGETIYHYLLNPAVDCRLELLRTIRR